MCDVKNAGWQNRRSWILLVALGVTLYAGGLWARRVVFLYQLDEVAGLWRSWCRPQWLTSKVPGRLNLLVTKVYKVRGGERFTDVHLAKLHVLPDAWELTLADSPVTDAGARYLGSLPSLSSLTLYGTQITDGGLESIGCLTNLDILYLGKMSITDDGLRCLAGLTRLERLYLAEMPVTDKGLQYLTGLTNLHVLLFRETEVTQEGVRDLHKALPDCDIQLKAR